MSLVYVALGSNLGVPEQQISQALESLANLPETSNLKISHWYKSAPIGGPADQPDYTNAVCSMITKLSPQQLLKELQEIETESGRTREVRWGPRTLDLDIIWFENFTSNTPELTIPHPRAHLRAFVLKPLLDLNAVFSLQNQTLQECLNSTENQRITEL